MEIASASVVKPVPSPAKCSAITDPAAAVKKLEKLVNQDLHLLLTIRHGISLNPCHSVVAEGNKEKATRVQSYDQVIRRTRNRYWCTGSRIFY